LKTSNILTFTSY